MTPLALQQYVLSHVTSLTSNDDLLCFGTLEITDRDFGLWRQTWLFLILLPPLAFAIKRFSFALLTVRVAQAPKEDYTPPRSSYRYAPPTSATNFRTYNDDSALGTDNS
jgi:hypothetical protein